MQERLAILLSKKLSGEASAGELYELEKWINDHPQDHYLVDILQTYWHNYPAESLLNIADNIHVDRILNKAELIDKDPFLQSAPVSTGKTGISRKWFAVAAAACLVLILMSALLFYWQTPFGMNSEKSEIVTSSGARSQIVLPDGSTVQLNAATRLHFDKDFNNTLREVYLEGEAFFDVKKNSNRPFIVHTSDLDIKVLGTAFNVKSYKEDATIEATLIHGSIQVNGKLKQGIPTIILSPNEKLVFSKLAKKHNKAAADAAAPPEKKEPLYLVSKVLSVAKDSSLLETSWVHGRLLFEGDTFEELAVKMERWFDVEINFENKETANYRLRGAFEDETIDEALKALQQIAPFKYSINQKTVTITK